MRFNNKNIAKKEFLFYIFFMINFISNNLTFYFVKASDRAGIAINIGCSGTIAALALKLFSFLISDNLEFKAQAWLRRGYPDIAETLKNNAIWLRTSGSNLSMRLLAVALGILAIGLIALAASKLRKKYCSSTS